MKSILGVRAQDARQEDQDWQDGLTTVVESRDPQPNLSFFAFTATPKGKTVELFGRPGPSGKPESFHVYSMRQAIEEEFILDVLQNYTDYSTYYRLTKQAADDPDFPKRRTAVALAKYMTLLGIRERLGQLMIERMGENDALVTRYLSDPEFQEVAFAGLARGIFQAVAKTSEGVLTD